LHAGVVGIIISRDDIAHVLRPCGFNRFDFNGFSALYSVVLSNSLKFAPFGIGDQKFVRFINRSDVVELRSFLEFIGFPIEYPVFKALIRAF